ncbi:DNA polymerase alpha/epsilon subunit B-domain-containing protein [Gorgonomyces haynaldii]|nr:DNA polymerase alpha/epsilon subunit B-domain-containing protein [Gorgonomyces haynaldii]
MVKSVSRIIYKLLSKKHGLRISSGALDYLTEIFESTGTTEESQLSESLDYIAKEYVAQYGGTHPVQKEHMEHVFQSILQKTQTKQHLKSKMDVQTEDAAQFLAVIGAFEVPKLRYNEESKSFLEVEQTEGLLNAPEMRIQGFRDRYQLIKQRVLRSPGFQTRSMNGDRPPLELTPIIHLRGKRPGSYLLLGMLTSIQDGKLYLEDPDAYIQVEIGDYTTPGSGLYTRNCFVLAKGDYTEDSKFLISTLAMPVPEPRTQTIKSLNTDVDFFGKKFTESDSFLSKVEKRAQDCSFVVVSDLWLDQSKTLEKLRVMFQGLVDFSIPLAFIMIGNFKSTPYIMNAENKRQYQEAFDQFAQLVAEFPMIAKMSHFIFVPGPNDPAFGNILPRQPIPEQYVQKVRQKITNCHFTTNPCRIRYCTQEIVVFRQDLVSMLRRNAILDVTQNTHEDVAMMSIEEHVVSTVLDQSYLVPLPLAVKPIYWGHEQSLMLYPQPHLLILADKHEPYQSTYEGCKAVNPGSFPNTDYSFSIYDPTLQQWNERYISLSQSNSSLVLPLDTLHKLPKLFVALLVLHLIKVMTDTLAVYYCFLCTLSKLFAEFVEWSHSLQKSADELDGGRIGVDKTLEMEHIPITRSIPHPTLVRGARIAVLLLPHI